MSGKSSGVKIKLMFFSNMEIFKGGLACSEHREGPKLEGHESQVVVM